ncbi:ubiquitin-protein transferase activating protein [Nowakowskiella sp. JEL0078]|nr:ubiquitin-protein transferase activating protein [Nowakowskiella sp. JEL0078]
MLTQTTPPTLKFKRRTTALGKTTSTLNLPVQKNYQRNSALPVPTKLEPVSTKSSVAPNSESSKRLSPVKTKDSPLKSASSSNQSQSPNIPQTPRPIRSQNGSTTFQPEQLAYISPVFSRIASGGGIHKKSPKQSPKQSPVNHQKRLKDGDSLVGSITETSPFKPIKSRAFDESPKKNYVPELANKTTAAKLIKHDRFIPNRTTMDMVSSQFNLTHPTDEKSEYVTDPSALQYQETLAKACGLALDQRILSFKSEPPRAREDLKSVWRRSANKSAPKHRRIPTIPERTLEAPGLADNYYLNLLDWSTQNVIAIALGSKVYTWNAETGDTKEFCDVSELGNDTDSITSLQWTNDGSYLAVGTNAGETQIWDAETEKILRNMKGRNSQVGVLSWDKHLLSSGANDGSIWNHDVRKSDHKIGELMGHTEIVCGLKWRPDGAMLASGGNDNLVNIWDARSSVPRYTKGDHTAAVKALAWCPWQLSLLATGGGTQDRKINFWNSTTGANISSIDTGSQVTSILWSREYKELVTSHGFPNNALSVWSYTRLAKIIDLEGHDARVLYTTMSPDGQTVASGAGDENLKFWKCFERRKKNEEGNTSGRKENVTLDDVENGISRIRIR